MPATMTSWLARFDDPLGTVLRTPASSALHGISADARTVFHSHSRYRQCKNLELVSG
jgi:hypothetical protein